MRVKSGTVYATAYTTTFMQQNLQSSIAPPGREQTNKTQSVNQ
jgi:hypothetical protein